MLDCMIAKCILISLFRMLKAYFTWLPVYRQHVPYLIYLPKSPFLFPVEQTTAQLLTSDLVKTGTTTLTATGHSKIYVFLLRLRYRNINTVFEGKKGSTLYVCFARILTNASFYAPAASFEDLGGYLGKREDTKCGCPRGMLSSVCHVCTCTVWPSPSHISLQTQITYSAVSAHTDRLGGHRFMGYFGLLSLNFKVLMSQQLPLRLNSNARSNLAGNGHVISVTSWTL